MFSKGFFFRVVKSEDCVVKSEQVQSSVISVFLKFFSGCDLNVQSSSGRTPLLESVINGSYDVAKVLVNAGCDLDRTDTKGTGALHQLCFTMNPNLELVDLIVKSRCYIIHYAGLCCILCRKWI